MPAPGNAAAFLKLVRKSRLVEPERLSDSFQEPPDTDEAPHTLARRLVRSGLLTVFQAEQLLQGKYKGFTIGKYRVLERIHSRGRGLVYLAEHVAMCRRVVLKVLPEVQADSAAARERFYHEARAAGAVSHPNIVRAYDVECARGPHFLVMEFVDGASLEEIVERFGPFAVTRAAQYLWQAAVGVQHALAKAGLVHRDLKPANLLLDRQGVIKILDLGLVHVAGEADDGPMTDPTEAAAPGTADYQAPELIRNRHAADTRADIYSLGATAYYLLTGQTPCDTPLRSLRPEVPEELAAVVYRMLAKDPVERYQSPAEVVAALEPWAQVPVPPPPVEEMPRRIGAVAVGPDSTVVAARTVHATARVRPATVERPSLPPSWSSDALATTVTDTIAGVAGLTVIAPALPRPLVPGPCWLRLLLTAGLSLVTGGAAYWVVRYWATAAL